MGNYSGLFLRHDINDTPQQPTTGWSSSPDLILFGRQAQTDLTQFTSAAGYMNPFGSTVYMDDYNYVYIRGLNTTNGAQTSRVYFYYTQSNLALWPVNWLSDGMTVANVAQNWLDISATSAGQIVVGQLPILWKAPELTGVGNHFCVVGWADNSTTPAPPVIQNFDSFDELAQFILAHPNMAWRNTEDILNPVPLDYTYTTGLSVQSAGGTAYIQVTFKNIPPDGTFSISVPGPDPQNTVSLLDQPVSKFTSGYSAGPLVYPSNYQTSVLVTHRPGATPLPSNAQISVLPLIQQGPALTAFHRTVLAPHGVKSPFFRITAFDRKQNERQVNVMAIGSQTYNLLYGAQASLGRQA
jgi:hypothetical protein